MKNICTLFIIAFCLMLPSCDVKRTQKKSEDVGVKEDINTPKELLNEHLGFEFYNMGDEWSRVPTKTFHSFHNTVLRASMITDQGKVSANFILLEKINNSEAYFLSTIHSMPSSCEEEGVSFVSKDNIYAAECSSLYSVVPDTDAVIFSVKFYDYQDLEKLEPVALVDKVFDLGEQLRFFGIDSDDLIPGYFPLITDSSDDCRLISNEEAMIHDPDKLHTINDASYWSRAVTCDVKHGDSGGMFINRDGDLVGVLWTGAYPKNSDYTSEKIYGLINDTSLISPEEMWSQFNYIVPGNRIKQHLRVVKASAEDEG